MVEVKQWMVWMVQNMLKLNGDKREFIVIGSGQQRIKIDIPHTNINGIVITLSSTVHTLGVMIVLYCIVLYCVVLCYVMLCCVV